MAQTVGPCSSHIKEFAAQVEKNKEIFLEVTPTAITICQRKAFKYLCGHNEEEVYCCPGTVVAAGGNVCSYVKEVALIRL
jgi:hypothetical protein